MLRHKDSNYQNIRYAQTQIKRGQTKKDQLSKILKSEETDGSQVGKSDGQDLVKRASAYLDENDDTERTNTLFFSESSYPTDILDSPNMPSTGLNSVEARLKRSRIVSGREMSPNETTLPQFKNDPVNPLRANKSIDSVYDEYLNRTRTFSPDFAKRVVNQGTSTGKSNKRHSIAVNTRSQYSKYTPFSKRDRGPEGLSRTPSRDQKNVGVMRTISRNTEQDMDRMPSFQTSAYFASSNSIHDTGLTQQQHFHVGHGSVADNRLPNIAKTEYQHQKESKTDIHRQTNTSRQKSPLRAKYAFKPRLSKKISESLFKREQQKNLEQLSHVNDYDGKIQETPKLRAKKEKLKRSTSMHSFGEIFTKSLSKDTDLGTGHFNWSCLDPGNIVVNPGSILEYKKYHKSKQKQQQEEKTTTRTVITKSTKITTTTEKKRIKSVKTSNHSKSQTDLLQGAENSQTKNFPIIQSSALPNILRTRSTGAIGAPDINFGEYDDASPTRTGKSKSFHKKVSKVKTTIKSKEQYLSTNSEYNSNRPEQGIHSQTGQTDLHIEDPGYHTYETMSPDIKQSKQKAKTEAITNTSTKTQTSKIKNLAEKTISMDHNTKFSNFIYLDDGNRESLANDIRLELERRNLPEIPVKRNQVNVRVPTVSCMSRKDRLRKTVSIDPANSYNYVHSGGYLPPKTVHGNAHGQNLIDLRDAAKRHSQCPLIYTEKTVPRSIDYKASNRLSLMSCKPELLANEQNFKNDESGLHIATNGNQNFEINQAEEESIYKEMFEMKKFCRPKSKKVNNAALLSRQHSKDSSVIINKREENQPNEQQSSKPIIKYQLGKKTISLDNSRFLNISKNFNTEGTNNVANKNKLTKFDFEKQNTETHGKQGEDLRKSHLDPRNSSVVKTNDDILTTDDDSNQNQAIAKVKEKESISTLSRLRRTFSHDPKLLKRSESKEINLLNPLTTIEETHYNTLKSSKTEKPARIGIPPIGSSSQNRKSLTLPRSVSKFSLSRSKSVDTWQQDNILKELQNEDELKNTRLRNKGVKNTENMPGKGEAQPTGSLSRMYKRFSYVHLGKKQALTKAERLGRTQSYDPKAMAPLGKDLKTLLKRSSSYDPLKDKQISGSNDFDNIRKVGSNESFGTIKEWVGSNDQLASEHGGVKIDKKKLQKKEVSKEEQFSKTTPQNESPDHMTERTLQTDREGNLGSWVDPQVYESEQKMMRSMTPQQKDRISTHIVIERDHVIDEINNQENNEDENYMDYLKRITSQKKKKSNREIKEIQVKNKGSPRSRPLANKSPNNQPMKIDPNFNIDDMRDFVINGSPPDLPVRHLPPLSRQTSSNRPPIADQNGFNNVKIVDVAKALDLEMEFNAQSPKPKLSAAPVCPRTPKGIEGLRPSPSLTHRILSRTGSSESPGSPLYRDRTIGVTPTGNKISLRSPATSYFSRVASMDRAPAAFRGQSITLTSMNSMHTDSMNTIHQGNLLNGSIYGNSPISKFNRQMLNRTCSSGTELPCWDGDIEKEVQDIIDVPRTDVQRQPEIREILVNRGHEIAHPGHIGYRTAVIRNQIISSDQSRVGGMSPDMSVGSLHFRQKSQSNQRFTPRSLIRSQSTGNPIVMCEEKDESDSFFGEDDSIAGSKSSKLGRGKSSSKIKNALREIKDTADKQKKRISLRKRSTNLEKMQ